MAGTTTAAAKPAQRPGHAPGTLGEWLGYIGARSDEADWIPVWPPDAFAIGAALLRRTGAYVGLVNGSHSLRKRSAGHLEEARATGEEWRKTLERTLSEGKTTLRLRDACPPAIRAWWQHMRRCSSRSIRACAGDTDLIAAAMHLCIASDTACSGIGVSISHDPFLAAADGVLNRNDRRSFCLHVPVDKLAVLGKQHTPQRGCTIRSLTHHLALYTPAEINAYWEGPYQPAAGDPDVFNLLLLPWPTEVGAADFRAATHRSGRPSGQPGVHRYFDYTPQIEQTPRALARRVARALDSAIAHADQIHGIVLPELALTPDQFLAVEKVAVARRAILISGLRGRASRETNDMPVNACAIQPLGLTAVRANTRRVLEGMRCVQMKHHRWCLDRGQILQYGLGGRLPAERDCWERVFIGRRDINFVTLGSWLTMCVLICEDLARQDPVAEVIRAVGPNLVFALLMDGPQLRNRWPSRYASVLAEDPGCSVLSLTSLGMSRRSRPRLTGTDTDKNSTVALWRDAVYGEFEIALEDGHDACVLSLVCKSKHEFTIDGRTDDQQAHFPVYAGTFSFAVDGPAR